jgi:type I restriction enzyme S subunit
MLDQKKNRGTYFPYLANTNVRWGKIDLENLREMRFEPKEFDRYGLKLGDIVMCEGGEPGRCAIWKGETASMMIQKALHRIRAKKGVDNAFLYYILLNKGIQGHYSGYFTGAAIKHLTGESLAKIKIEIPPIQTQQKIAQILSAYDDLIENNLKRIKLLEEMAQITYEQWFVRMKFPNHETTPINAETGLPEGWKYQPIGSLLEHEIGGGWGKDEALQDFSEPAYVIRGTDFKSLALGDLTSVPFRFHKKSNLLSRKLNNGDIVFEVSGGSHNAGVAKTILITDKLLMQFDNDVMCASFCKLVRPNEVQYSYLLFHFFQYLRDIKATEVFEIRSASNIVNYNWTAFLKFQQIPVPNKDTLQDFSRLISPVHSNIYQLGKQNNLLKEAREILLPRLMTGMIDVDKIKLPKPLNKNTHIAPTNIKQVIPQ